MSATPRVTPNPNHFYDVGIYVANSGYLTPTKLGFLLNDAIARASWNGDTARQERLVSLQRYLYDINDAMEYTAVDRGFVPRAAGRVSELYFVVPCDLGMSAQEVRALFWKALSQYGYLTVTVNDVLGSYYNL